jgi:septum formation topological specificity factor MinE
MMEQMRREIMEVVSRYAEINDGCHDVNVDENTPRKGGKYR